MLYIISKIIFTCAFTDLISQEVKITGSAEAGYNYNNLASSYSLYPKDYWFFQSKVMVDLFDVPFDVSLRLTSLSSGITTERLYPNFLNISYNQEKLRQNLQKRAESKFNEYLLQKTKKEHNEKLLNSLDSLKKNLPDTNLLKQQRLLFNNLINGDVLIQEQVIREEKELKSLYYQIEEARKQAMEENSQITIDTTVEQYHSLFKGKNTDIKEMNTFLQTGGWVRLFSRIKEFQIGRFPWSTENVYISQSVMVDGIQMNFDLKPVSTGLVLGKLFPIILWHQWYGWTEGIAQNVSGAATGLSVKNHTLKAEGFVFEGKGKMQDFIENTNQKNTLFGLSYVYRGKYVSLTTHLAASQISINNESSVYFFQGLPVVYNFSADNVLQNILQQRIANGLHTGYASQTELLLYAGKTFKQTAIKYERLSPFYYSSAAPFILNDQHTMEIAQQVAISKSITLGIAGLYREDNLSKLKNITTNWKTLTISQIFRTNDKFIFNSFVKLIERHSLASIVQYQYGGMFTYKPEGRWLKTVSSGVMYFDSKGMPSSVNVTGSMEIPVIYQLSVVHRGSYIRLFSTSEVIVEQYSYQPEVQYLGDGWNIGAGSLWYFCKNSLAGKSVEANAEINLNKWLKIACQAGYGQNKNVLQTLVNLVTPEQYLQTDYWFGNFKMIVLW